MALTNDTLGQMYALTVMTPIKPGAEPALRAYLEGFRDRGTPSPLARLPRTHFGRWVIVPGFVQDPTQRRQDDLGGPVLIFSATLDGDRDTYLDELSDELGDEAERIWGACIGAPTPARGPDLKAYLLHNQIHTGLFFSAYPDVPVDRVKQRLARREQTVAFAVRSQGMSAEELHQAFLAEF